MVEYRTRSLEKCPKKTIQDMKMAWRSGVVKLAKKIEADAIIIHSPNRKINAVKWR